MPLNIALEGLPGAGKTTCFGKLLQILNSSHIGLSEVNPKPKDFWGKSDVITQGDFFDQAWKERGELITKSRYSFLLDRSHFSNLAYWYARDALDGTQYYQSRKHFLMRNIPHSFLGMIIILHCPIEVSIYRRKNAGIPTDDPWDNTIFLEAFYNFYISELPQLTKSEILSFDTYRESLDVVIDYIAQKLPNNNRKYFEIPIPNSIEQYAAQLGLGLSLASLQQVLGRPTVYYRQHSLQIDNGEVVYFDNSQLRKILRECE